MHDIIGPFVYFVYAGEVSEPHFSLFTFEKNIAIIDSERVCLLYLAQGRGISMGRYLALLPCLRQHCGGVQRQTTTHSIRLSIITTTFTIPSKYPWSY